MPSCPAQPESYPDGQHPRSFRSPEGPRGCFALLPLEERWRESGRRPGSPSGSRPSLSSFEHGGSRSPQALPCKHSADRALGASPRSPSADPTECTQRGLPLRPGGQGPSGVCVARNEARPLRGRRSFRVVGPVHGSRSTSRRSPTAGHREVQEERLPSSSSRPELDGRSFRPAPRMTSDPWSAVASPLERRTLPNEFAMCKSRPTSRRAEVSQLVFPERVAPTVHLRFRPCPERASASDSRQGMRTTERTARCTASKPSRIAGNSARRTMFGPSEGA